MKTKRIWIAAAGLGFAFLTSPFNMLAAHAQDGHASWYALTSRTASGEPMNASAMTAAHRSLPFGTRVRVDNVGNGRSVVVRINDRGPFVRGRIIDVSRAAASQLGFIAAGTARVRLTVQGGRGTVADARMSGAVADAGSSDASAVSAAPSRAIGTGRIVWVDSGPRFEG